MNFAALFPDAILFILGGIKTTLGVTGAALCLGLPFGIALAIFKVSSWSFLRLFSQFYTSIFRGTPVLVQLSIVYYGLPQLLGYRLSAFEAGVLTLGFNTAAYSSEVVRSGIESLDKGQWEAAKVLGLSNSQTLFGIILPQAIRNILPALINEGITLLKESALVSVIGEIDILERAKKVMYEKYLYFEPLLIAALLYYVLVLIFSSFGRFLENKLKNA